MTPRDTTLKMIRCCGGLWVCVGYLYPLIDPPLPLGPVWGFSHVGLFQEVGGRLWKTDSNGPFPQPWDRVDLVVIVFHGIHVLPNAFAAVGPRVNCWADGRTRFWPQVPSRCWARSGWPGVGWVAPGGAGGGAFLRNWTPCGGLQPPPLFLNAPWEVFKGFFGCRWGGGVLQGKKKACVQFYFSVWGEAGCCHHQNTPPILRKARQSTVC